MPPVSASGTALKTSSASRARAKRCEQQQKDQRRSRQAPRSSAAAAPRRGFRTGRPKRSNIPAEVTCCATLLLRLGDQRADVAAAHIRRHDDAPLAVLAADLVGPLGKREASQPARAGWLRDGRSAVGRQRHRQIASVPRDWRARSSGKPDHDLETPVALEHQPGIAPADRRADNILHGGRCLGRGARSPPCRSLISRNGRPVGLLDPDVRGAVDAAQHAGDLVAPISASARTRRQRP